MSRNLGLDCKFVTRRTVYQLKEGSVLPSRTDDFYVLRGMNGASWTQWFFRLPRSCLFKLIRPQQGTKSECRSDFGVANLTANSLVERPRPDSRPSLLSQGMLL